VQGEDGERQTSVVLWGLVALNVAVHLLWLGARDDAALRDFMAANFLLTVEGVFQGRVWTLLTAAVSHYDGTHLIFNLIAFHAFARAVGLTIGPQRLLGLYVFGALASSLADIGVSLLTGDLHASLGASGAVNAIATVFALLYPRARLIVLFLPMQAWMAVLLFLALDLAGAMSPVDTGIGHVAHLGGTLFGFLYWLLRIRPLLDRREPRS
jgi:membrane associated rhomboid family serine protease